VARWETGRNEPKGAYLKALNALETKAKKRAEKAKAGLKLTGRF